jgi:hypothetical protein
VDEQERYDDLRSRLRVLKADVAHLSARLDQYDGTVPGSDMGPGAESAKADDVPPGAEQDADLTDGEVHAHVARATSLPRGGWQQLPAALAAQAWAELTRWVDELVARYELHEQLPTCWYRHGAMVEELHALHTSWYGAYASPQAGPADPVYWHDQLERVLTRIRTWDIRGCVSGQHRSAPPPTVDPTLRSERGQYIDADLHRRAAHETRDAPVTG